MLENRGQYATFITILSAGMVLTVASLLILQFESSSPDANIKTGGDAIWWGVVTLTTVGYGDRYPVTLLGRLTAVSVMFAGVGIIGALASILASMLVPPPKEDEAAPAPPAAVSATDAATGPVASTPAGASIGPAAAQASAATASTASTTDAIVEELASLRAEIAALRASLPAGPP